MSETEQVILIGLDGLGYGELEPWLSNGTLPTLKSLADDGSSRNLKSTHPPWTPCAWPSFLSGRNPGAHGVFDFFTRDGYNKRLIERADVDASYLFEAADANNKTSLVINYPVTQPASKLKNGAVVPGYLASEDVSFHPQNLRKEYESEYGKYVVYPEYGTDKNPVDEYVDVARGRRDLARFLDERYEWDLLAVQFQVTDSIFHDLDDRDEILSVLESVDSFVADIIDLGDTDASVFVASDHGMGDYEWTFYINSWLSEQGYCKTTEGDAQYFRQQKSQLKGTSRDIKDGKRPVEEVVTTIVNHITSVGLSPQLIHRGLSKIGLAQTIVHLLPEDVLVAAQNRVVDHQESMAFQLYFNSLGIHLNVKDRDPKGVILESDYESTRSKLIERLKTVRDPDGNRVFQNVLPREDVYSGEHLEDAPDILLEPRDYVYDVSGSILNTFRRNPHKNHKPEGIILSNRNLDIPHDGASIYDVAPTVAAALNIPVDSRTDGEVISPFDETKECVDWDELAGDYRTKVQRDTGENQEIEDRLADLGYME